MQVKKRNSESQEKFCFSTVTVVSIKYYDSEGKFFKLYLDATCFIAVLPEFCGPAGWGGGESAFVGSIGPGLYFTGFKEKINISMGINPTIISKHKFGDENLGGPVQFTSHIGLIFIFANHYSIGYRLQHMSNAVLYESNPGLNMHIIEVGYRF